MYKMTPDEPPKIDKEERGKRRLEELKRQKVAGRVTFWTNKGEVNDVEVVEKI